MGQRNIEKVSIMGWALAIVCFISNISQLPIIVDRGLSSLIAMATWGLFAVFCICYGIKWKILKSIIPILIMALIYGVFICLMEIFSANSYLSSSLIYPIFLSIFILFIATNIGHLVSSKDLENIATAYIWGALVVCVNVYFEYLVNANIADRVYAYDSKNSVAQILFTAFLLIFLFKFSRKKLLAKILYLAIALFLLVSILLLKSRATIIAIPCSAVFALLLGSKKDKYFRWKMLFLLVGIVLYLVFFPQIYQTLINDILLGGRDNGNLNDVTSGRWGEWENFFADLGNGWLLGNGRMKRESLILTAILEYGFPIGTMIIALAVMPLIYALKNIKNRDKIVETLFYVAAAYFLNAIFEQLAPFGPGVKCYFLWLIFGIALAKKNEIGQKGALDYKQGRGY